MRISLRPNCRKLVIAAYSAAEDLQRCSDLERATVSEVQYGIPDFADEQKRVIAATVGDIRVVCVYIPNGQSIDSEQIPVQAWLAHSAARLAETGAATPSEAGAAGRLQYRA